jgi:hypothetical protein
MTLESTLYELRASVQALCVRNRLNEWKFRKTVPDFDTENVLTGNKSVSWWNFCTTWVGNFLTQVHIKRATCTLIIWQHFGAFYPDVFCRNTSYGGSLKRVSLNCVLITNFTKLSKDDNLFCTYQIQILGYMYDYRSNYAVTFSKCHQYPPYNLCQTIPLHAKCNCHMLCPCT